MAIVISPKPGAGTTATALLQAIKSKIDSGSIRTWRYEGNNLFHTGETGDTEKEKRWDKGGYLELREKKLAEDRVAFYYNVLPDTSPEPGTYATLNSRLVEMLLNHFRQQVIVVVQYVAGNEVDG